MLIVACYNTSSLFGIKKGGCKRGLLPPYSLQTGGNKLLYIIAAVASTDIDNRDIAAVLVGDHNRNVSHRDY